ncbi:glycine betaine ABC transporter substrate-binding protein [Streptomyces sp. NBC_01264]|uniref:glycine betaine ABC transporter substrate-binding protein n=1 Tax=Streptomyces sp. NBC_01264 TaxID=2903804 RepID=UPI0022570803|nr:glycine betaine ABC transporter substrate-binding protein [Streptomyces sp. NBC_01264]MCX4776410.1 ABC transporter substrate-binding protein [Streptomyces sp. NBC_01264]
MPRNVSRRALLLAAAVALTASTTVACGADGGDSAAKPGRTTVRIAYQAIPNADLIVKNQRLLEQALPDAEVKWVKFESGGDVNTAVIAGSVDLGLAGSSPVTKGLSAPLNIPYKVVWIHDLIGDNEALVAKPGIGSVKDLAGKKVATPFGSTAHYSLLAALKAAGVDPAAVQTIDLQPQDALAAWKRGDIDAAYVWTPTLSELARDGKVLVTSRQLAEQGKPTADLGVVTNAFAAAHPEVVTAWIKAQDQAVGQARTAPRPGREVHRGGARAGAGGGEAPALGAGAAERKGADRPRLPRHARRSREAGGHPARRGRLPEGAEEGGLRSGRGRLRPGPRGGGARPCRTLSPPPQPSPRPAPQPAPPAGSSPWTSPGCRSATDRRSSP